MRYSTWFHHRSTRPIGALPIVAILCAGTLAAQTPECPGYDLTDGIVWGIVRAMEGGAAVAGADVVVSWEGGDSRAQTLSNGIYIVCGVRPDSDIVVEAHVGRFHSEGVSTPIDEGEILEVHLGVAFTRGTRATITGRVVGRVVDRTTLEPIVNAMIGAENLYTEVTDRDGRFELDGVEPGVRMISVRHLAYGETESRFDMPWEGTLDLEIRLDPAVLAVEPISVEVLGVRSQKLENAGFYERKTWSDRLGLGHYLTRAEIEQRGAAQVSHVLAEVPRVRFETGGCFASRCSFPVISGSGANCARMKQEGGEYRIGASIYLDGVRQRMATGGVAMGIDDLIKPADIAGVEVYSGSGDLPGEFSDFNAQKCGAVVIWTGR